jgi:hypothetical protein
MTKTLWIIAIAVVIALGVSFIAIESKIATLDQGGVSLQGKLADAPKQVISLNLELYKLFSTLSTAIIGGIAFYLHKGRRSRGARIIAVIVSLSVVISLFFGHLWIAMMRNQIANDFFSPAADSVVLCERFQYGFFLVALVLFAMLILVEDFSSAPSTPAST